MNPAILHLIAMCALAKQKIYLLYWVEHMIGRNPMQFKAYALNIDIDNGQIAIKCLVQPMRYSYIYIYIYISHQECLLCFIQFSCLGTEFLEWIYAIFFHVLHGCSTDSCNMNSHIPEAIRKKKKTGNSLKRTTKTLRASRVDICRKVRWSFFFRHATIPLPSSTSVSDELSPCLSQHPDSYMYTIDHQANW